MRQTTDADGILRYGVNYDPYGNPIEQIVNPVGFGYTGAQTDDNGLVYLHNRYYDPRTGAFITPDPIDGGGAQWNAYAYANGNPINNIDPDGCSAIAIAGGAIALRFAIGFVADAGMQYLTNCGQVDWGQATISGGIAVATGGLDKVGKLGRVGRFAAETLLEAGAFTAYDRARGRNTNFFGNVADSAIGNLIGEGIGYGLGRAGRNIRGALSSSRLDFNAVTMGGFPVLKSGFSSSNWIDNVATRIVVNSDLAITRQLHKSSPNSVEDVFAAINNRSPIARIAHGWLDRRGWQVLYRGQGFDSVKAGKGILSPIARTDGVQRSIAVYNDAIRRGLTHEEVIGYTARWNDGPPYGEFQGIGGVGIPSASIPGVSVNPVYTTGESPVLYVLRVPKGTASYAGSIGWNKSRLEQEWVFLHQIDNNYVFRSIDISKHRIPILKPNDSDTHLISGGYR